MVFESLTSLANRSHHIHSLALAPESNLFDPSAGQQCLTLHTPSNTLLVLQIIYSTSIIFGKTAEIGSHTVQMQYMSWLDKHTYSYSNGRKGSQHWNNNPFL